METTLAIDEIRMNEIMEELEREIKEVHTMKTTALEKRHWNDWDKAHARLNGLFFCRHLLKGNKELLNCYQTNIEGVKYNSGGFRLRGN